MQVLWGFVGIVVLMAIAFLLSKNRRAINLRTVIGAPIIQIAFAVIVLYWDLGRRALRLLTDGVQAVINASNAGIEFLFGPVLRDERVAFAFQVLPISIFFASLTSVLYYLKILQWVVELLGRALQKALGTSGPESLSVTSDIFLGPTEAPPTVRPCVEKAPVAFVIGVPWNEALDAGSFIGQKTILNEFVAYSNFGTIAILIGGVGGMAPSRQHQIAQFGIRALIAGTLANLLNAAIAGMLVG
jgi:nucleoside permease NupC